MRRDIVSANAPALIAAAAGVGVGHAVLPDHWVPLAVVGRTERYPLARVARLSALAAVAHVLVSLLLGTIIIVVGLQLRGSFQSAQSTIIGGILLLTGVGFAVLHLAGRGHRHDPDHDHGTDHHHPDTHTHAQHPQPTGGARRVMAIMVPFGAAASPDLTILPVFLAAAAAGGLAAAGALVSFALATIVTIVGLTLLACFGSYQLRGQWLERWGNLITAATLALIGALVLAGVI